MHKLRNQIKQKLSIFWAYARTTEIACTQINRLKSRTEQSFLTWIYQSIHLRKYTNFETQYNGDFLPSAHVHEPQTACTFIDFWQTTRRFTVHKTNSPKLCKPPTHLEVVKTHSPNFYMPSARFAVVKTHSPKLCKSSTRYAVVQMHSPKLFTPPTCLRYSKALLASNTFCGSKNTLYKDLQASYTLSGCLNSLRISQSLLNSLRWLHALR